MHAYLYTRLQCQDFAHLARNKLYVGLYKLETEQLYIHVYSIILHPDLAWLLQCLPVQRHPSMRRPLSLVKLTMPRVSISRTFITEGVRPICLDLSPLFFYSLSWQRLGVRRNLANTPLELLQIYPKHLSRRVNRLKCLILKNYVI